jgi:hypothetical protein
MSGMQSHRVTPPSEWSQIKDYLFYYLELDWCLLCLEPAQDIHHGLLRRDKHCKQVNHIINAWPLCDDCHENKEKNKHFFLNIQIMRFGANSVMDFFEQLPERKKRDPEVRKMISIAKGRLAYEELGYE